MFPSKRYLHESSINILKLFHIASCFTNIKKLDCKHKELAFRFLPFYRTVLISHFAFFTVTFDSTFDIVNSAQEDKLLDEWVLETSRNSVSRNARNAVKDVHFNLIV